MDDKLQIALLKRYVDKIEAPIRQDHGDKPFVAVYMMIEDYPAVPQEMTAREFIRTYYRMCGDVYLYDCTECPIRTAADGYKCTCEGFMRSHPDEAAEIVEQWAREHPERSE